MSYAVRDFSTILEGMLADWRNRVPGVNTDPATEVYMRSAVVAGAIWGLEYGLTYVEDQIFPTSADFPNLKRHADTLGVVYKVAESADDGTITLTGVNGTVVAAGLAIAHDDGTTYTTTSGGIIFGALLSVSAAAEQVGTVGNKGVGTALRVQSPPAGVDVAATVATPFLNGTDDETQAALLARVLNRIRLGNAGGTANDYEQWALTIGGVSVAYALPLRRGVGTVDVAVFGLDGDGNRLPTSAPVRAEVLAYIETVRPVTADVQVPEITLLPADVDVTLTVLDEGLLVADVEDDVTAAIEAYLYSIRPGGTLYLTQLMRAIAVVDGVIDFEVTAPAANVVSALTSTTVEAFEPGTITVS